MQVIRQSDYRIMPWKNGGGTTTEIYVSPVDSVNFDWRVSIATVNADGPFSLFNGYDRHILTLQGAGMRLDIEAGDSIELGPKEIFSFSGDERVEGFLSDGPVKDFNLIVQRDFGVGTLKIAHCASGCSFGSEHALQLVHILDGDSYLLEIGDFMSFYENQFFVICEIRPRLPHEPGV